MPGVKQRFETNKHKAPLQMFVCINAAIKTQNFENLHHSLNAKRLNAFSERTENALFFPIFNDL